VFRNRLHFVDIPTRNNIVTVLLLAVPNVTRDGVARDFFGLEPYQLDLWCNSHLSSRLWDHVTRCLWTSVSKFIHSPPLPAETDVRVAKEHEPLRRLAEEKQPLLKPPQLMLGSHVARQMSQV
jgi:hypothetical protein